MALISLRQHDSRSRHAALRMEGIFDFMRYRRRIDASEFVVYTKTSHSRFTTFILPQQSVYLRHVHATTATSPFPHDGGNTASTSTPQ